MTRKESRLEVTIVFDESTNPHFASGNHSGEPIGIYHEEAGERLLEGLRNRGSKLPVEAQVSSRSEIVMCALEETWGEIQFELQLESKASESLEQAVRETLERCFNCEIEIESEEFFLEEALVRTLETVVDIRRCKWSAY